MKGEHPRNYEAEGPYPGTTVIVHNCKNGSDRQLGPAEGCCVEPSEKTEETGA